jgi:acetylornithine/succinyldiaminopimelate/putrescine aminotransferase
MKVLLKENLIASVGEKEQLFLNGLSHPKIKSIRSKGLMIAVEFENFEANRKIINVLIGKGIFTDWFLFASNCLRIVPPLTISTDEINTACEILNNCLDT